MLPLYLQLSQKCYRYFFNFGLIYFRSKQYLYMACFSLVERKIPLLFSIITIFSLKKKNVIAKVTVGDITF
jgi:hypothetical protein